MATEDYLVYLARLAIARPELAEFIRRLAGSVRKLAALAD